MTFEIRKVSDVGTKHPVVARLAPQTIELVNWLNWDNRDKREPVLGLYINTLKPKLLRCHEIRDDLVNKINGSIDRVSQQSDPRVREVPHVVGLQGIVEGFLYETKNYLRDLLGLFQTVYGCKLNEASAFTDLKGTGESAVVKWATTALGPDDALTKLLKTEEGWTGEFIRMRNAVEHPDGFSGRLTVENIRVHQKDPPRYLLPTWQRTGRPASDIVDDMDGGLESMLTIAEDLLAHVIMRQPSFKQLTIYEIAIENRDPKCPIRFRVGWSPEQREKMGKP